MSLTMKKITIQEMVEYGHKAKITTEESEVRGAKPRTKIEILGATPTTRGHDEEKAYLTFTGNMTQLLEAQQFMTKVLAEVLPPKVKENSPGFDFTNDKG